MACQLERAWPPADAYLVKSLFTDRQLQL